MNSAALLTPDLPADIRWVNGLANTLFALVGVMLLASALLWLARLPVFAIRAIRVEGDVTRNTPGTIRAAAMPKLAGNFFTVDLEKARQAFESVPWVRSAVVHRVWPGVLAVRIEEHHPAALWQQDDADDELVDTEGDVFDANLGDVEDDGLPTFSGPDGSAAQMLAMYRELQPVFEQRMQAGIDTLTLSSRGSWAVDLDKGASIELGRGDEDEVLARTERFLRTVPQVVAHFQRPLQSADLRHQDGYAVKLQGVTTLPDAPPGAKRAAPATKTRTH